MKRWMGLFLLFFLFILAPLLKAQSSSTVPIYLFYAEDCPHCQAILQSYVPTLNMMYPFLDIKTFDLANPSYYEALAKLEKRFQRKADELPVLFIGDQMLFGEREVMEKLDPLIIEYQMKGSLAPALPPLEIPSKVVTSEKLFSVDLAYFYQKGCPKCDRASYLLKYINEKYPHLHIKSIDLNTDDGKRLNETLSNRLGLPQEKRLIAPSIFIGNDYLSPEEITESKVEALIAIYEKVEAKSALKVEEKEIQQAETSMIERFKSLGVFTVLSAGFIDGLNPCAFATLIFFISYLTFVGRKRREILLVGIGFSGAVFITYLLIGFGVLSFIQHLSFLPILSKIIYVITLIIALVLGGYSLYDYVKLKQGRASEMKLQLPDFLKRRIHQTIREGSKSSRYFIAAIAAGFIISILEFACTGQVYLPTILFVTNIPSLRASAFSYLLLYNLMFILPLLIIFGIAYWGVTSEQLAQFLRYRASTIKLSTALVFFVLAGVLILNLV